MFNRLGIVLLAFLFALVGCGDSDRYELSKDAAGRTIRLDKKTGEIAVLEGSQLQVLNPRGESESCLAQDLTPAMCALREKA